MPAEAGIQWVNRLPWIPAFAGTTIAASPEQESLNLGCKKKSRLIQYRRVFQKSNKKREFFLIDY
jgi:hypothetical protein